MVGRDNVARTWVVLFAALLIAPIAAIGGGTKWRDISWTHVALTAGSAWTVSISANSWEEIREDVGSGLKATAARVDRVFAENGDLWHLAYVWSADDADVWHDVCFMCEYSVLTGEMGPCFGDVIEKTETSSGQFSCSRNARELKAAVDRYASFVPPSKGIILTFPGYSNTWIFPRGAIPEGWTDGTIAEDWVSEMLSEWGIRAEDLMFTDGAMPEDWVSRMLLERELLPRGWMFADGAMENARMYLEGGIAEGWMFREGWVVSEHRVAQGGIGSAGWIFADEGMPSGGIRGTGLRFPYGTDWWYSEDAASSVVDHYFERGIREGLITSSAPSFADEGAIGRGGISGQGWMFSAGRLFPEGRAFPEGGIIAEQGDWRLKRARLFQLDEEAPNSRVSFGWLKEPVEYELDIGGVAFGEDNAGALTMYIPGFSIDLRWDPGELGGSGLFAEVYDTKGQLHEWGGRRFRFELPSTVVSSFQKELNSDGELRLNVRLDPKIGEITVRDPWTDGSLWKLNLGESIAEGSIGVGTKSLRASFGNFASAPQY